MKLHNRLYASRCLFIHPTWSPVTPHVSWYTVPAACPLRSTQQITSGVCSGSHSDDISAAAKPMCESMASLVMLSTWGVCSSATGCNTPIKFTPRGLHGPPQEAVRPSCRSFAHSWDFLDAGCIYAYACRRTCLIHLTLVVNSAVTSQPNGALSSEHLRCS